jgi:hypothetical protein
MVRKATLANGKHRLKLKLERETLWIGQEGKCYWCGKQCHRSTGMKPKSSYDSPEEWQREWSTTFTVDHVEPLCGNGTNDLENLVGACSLCNQKRNKEWTLKENARLQPNSKKMRKLIWNIQPTLSPMLDIIGGKGEATLLDIRARLRTNDTVSAKDQPLRPVDAAL